MTKLSKGLVEAVLKVIKPEVEVVQEEQIDEISKDTLKTYVTKANDDITDKAKDFLKKDSTKSSRRDALDAISKRNKGIKQARSKMEEETEEVEQIDELSRGTISRYSAKAKSIADNEGGKDRTKGRELAHRKNWGTKGNSFGLTPPKVASTNEEAERLTKEETEVLDELSKDTLKSYIKKSEKEESKYSKEAQKYRKKEQKHNDEIETARSKVKNASNAWSRQAEYGGDAGYHGAKRDLGNKSRAVTNALTHLKKLEKHGTKHYTPADAKAHEKVERKSHNRSEGIWKASEQMYRTPEEHKDHIKNTAIKAKENHKREMKSSTHLVNVKKITGLATHPRYNDRLVSKSHQEKKTHEKLEKAGFKREEGTRGDHFYHDGKGNHISVTKHRDGSSYHIFSEGLKAKLENLDEISKEKLGQYINKSAADIEKHADKAGRDPFDTNSTRKALKRQRGIATAVRKITKEEVEDLDEGRGKKGRLKQMNKRDHEEDEWGLEKKNKKQKISKPQKSFAEENVEVESIDEDTKMSKVKAKLQSIHQKEMDAHDKHMTKLNDNLHNKFHKEAPKILEKHGFKKISDGDDSYSYAKPSKSGHVTVVNISKHKSKYYGTNYGLHSTTGSHVGGETSHNGIYSTEDHDKHSKEMMPKFESKVIEAHNQTEAGPRF